VRCIIPICLLSEVAATSASMRCIPASNSTKGSCGCWARLDMPVTSIDTIRAILTNMINLHYESPNKVFRKNSKSAGSTA
jgi:hypothetical protein